MENVKRQRKNAYRKNEKGWVVFAKSLDHPSLEKSTDLSLSKFISAALLCYTYQSQCWLRSYLAFSLDSWTVWHYWAQYVCMWLHLSLKPCTVYCVFLISTPHRIIWSNYNRRHHSGAIFRVTMIYVQRTLSSLQREGNKIICKFSNKTMTKKKHKIYIWNNKKTDTILIWFLE